MARKRPIAPGHAPIPVKVLAGLAALVIVVPLASLVLGAPWNNLLSHWTQPAATRALWLSLWTSGAATVLTMLLGVPLAWVLATSKRSWAPTMRALALVPLISPPVVGGVALLMAYGRQSLIGGWLDRTWGVSIPFTAGAVIVAQTFVAMPFTILTMESAFRTYGEKLSEAAATLGANTWTTIRLVTVPTLRPALLASAALAWARALGEFGATITFAGNVPGRTQTIPAAIYQTLDLDLDAALSLALLMITVSLTVLVAMRSSWWTNS